MFSTQRTRCSVVNCPTRRKLMPAVYLFEAPSDLTNLEHGENFFHPGTKLLHRYICEKHYEEDVIDRSSVIPRLKPGANPTVAWKQVTSKEASNSRHGGISGSQPSESGSGSSENAPATNGSSRPFPLALRSSDQGLERKRIKLDTHFDVEDCLLMWYIQSCKQNLPVTGQILQEKAAEFAQLLGHENQHFSDAWVSKFKSKKGIALKKQREDFLAQPSPIGSTPNTAESSHAKQFDVTSSYSQKDIFIVFETGLLYKLLPDAKPDEWSSKIIRSADGEFSEERFTLVMACNMDGTEKLPLIVIGNKEDGTQLSNTLVPIEYITNQLSWVTCDIIENLLYRLERRMQKYGRKIALVTENGLFGAVGSSLRNIQVFVRPPHSVRYITLQSCRIITALKLRYRKNLLTQVLKMCIAGEDSQIKFTDSLCWLSSAWLEIKPDAYISSENMGVHVSGEQEMFEECQRIIEEFCLQKGYVNEVGNFSVDSYVKVDDHMCIMGSFTTQEIVTIFQKYNSPSRSVSHFGEANNISQSEGNSSAEENSRSHSNSNTRPFLEDGNFEVANAVIVPNITVSNLMLTSPEQQRETPASVTSDGENGVELRIFIEPSSAQQTSSDPAFDVTNETTAETANETHSQLHVDCRLISERNTEVQASYKDSGHRTYTQNLSNSSSSMQLETNRVTEGTSRCTSMSPFGNLSPYYRASLPTAGDAMSALMVVHNYMLSKPSVDRVVTDSFCHLVRFMSEAVANESQNKC